MFFSFLSGLYFNRSGIFRIQRYFEQKIQYWSKFRGTFFESNYWKSTDFLKNFVEYAYLCTLSRYVAIACCYKLVIIFVYGAFKIVSMSLYFFEAGVNTCCREQRFSVGINTSLDRIWNALKWHLLFLRRFPKSFWKRSILCPQEKWRKFSVSHLNQQSYNPKVEQESLFWSFTNR